MLRRNKRIARFLFAFIFAFTMILNRFQMQGEVFTTKPVSGKTGLITEVGKFDVQYLSVGLANQSGKGLGLSSGTKNAFQFRNNQVYYNRNSKPVKAYLVVQGAINPINSSVAPFFYYSTSYKDPGLPVLGVDDLELSSTPLAMTSVAGSSLNNVITNVYDITDVIDTKGSGYYGINTKAFGDITETNVSDIPFSFTLVVLEENPSKELYYFEMAFGGDKPSGQTMAFNLPGSTPPGNNIKAQVFGSLGGVQYKQQSAIYFWDSNNNPLKFSGTSTVINSPTTILQLPGYVSDDMFGCFAPVYDSKFISPGEQANLLNSQIQSNFVFHKEATIQITSEGINFKIAEVTSSHYELNTVGICYPLGDSTNVKKTVSNANGKPYAVKGDTLNYSFYIDNFDTYSPTTVILKDLFDDPAFVGASFGSPTIVDSSATTNGDASIDLGTDIRQGLTVNVPKDQAATVIIPVTLSSSLNIVTAYDISNTVTMTVPANGTVPSYDIESTAAIPYKVIGVRYDANGATEGTVPVDNETYMPGKNTTVLGNIGNLARAGFDFIGWGTKPNDLSSLVEVDSTISIPEEGLNLYALWKISFIVTLYPSEDKIYQPNFAPTTAKIRTIGTVTIDTDHVQYMMLPTTDTTPITTKLEFEAKAATLEDKYKGVMHETGAGTYEYNMYSNNDPNLNGVLENCRLVVMATGTDTFDNSELVAFDSHVFTNIYTPIDVYYNGVATSGSALYSNIRVGIGNHTEAIYGLPLDLDGRIIANPSAGYDKIDVIHKDLEPLWRFNSSDQGDVQALILDQIDYKDKVYKFKYDKNTDNWYRATFKFEDDLGQAIPGYPNQVVDDFIANDSGNNSYMFGVDLYAPPIIDNYDPIGYKIGNGALVRMSFPLKYGEIVLTGDEEEVTIVYSQDQIRVKEEYHLFERDHNGVEVDKGEISGYSANISAITNGELFTGTPIDLKGYVYRGYAVVGGEENYLDSPHYPMDPYDIVPTITPNSDTIIIYKYKIDATDTGYADEDTKRIMITATGIDGHAQVVGTLYTKPMEKILYGETFTPSPLMGTDTDDHTGSVDEKGNTILVDKEGVHWILNQHPDLYNVDTFTVKENRTINFYYYKDTSGNGIPDYMEANITLQYWDEKNNIALLNAYIISEYSSTESFSRSAPTINGYIAVGVVVYKVDQPEGAPDYTTTKGEIGTLGPNNWMMKFLYQPDGNKNGIPDNMESKITVKTVYQLENGEEETTQTQYVGRHGESLYLSTVSLNKDSNKFEYVSGLDTLHAAYTYNQDHPQTIIVIFREKITIPTPEPTPSPTPEPTPTQNTRGRGGRPESEPETSIPMLAPTTAPTPIETPTSTPAPMVIPISTSEPTQKPNARENNYRWSTFEKPEEIFLDGDLIPLSRLVYNGPYIYGYPDKTIQPDGNLTRAEASQIIYNLYGKPEIDVNTTHNFPYKDLREDAWYANAVAFLTQYEIVSGYLDGLFYPNKPITRAELVTLLAQYNHIDDNTGNENVFEDVAHHWAKAQINAAFKNNWVSGFPDGTFKPNDLATRSEAVIIINKMLKRPDQWIGADEFLDLNERNWAYEKLMNASNGYAED